MSRLAGRGALALMGIAACLGLAGCVYDYTNHEDRLSYSAGDAVKANLIKETVDPEYPGMYSKKGLGRNGRVIGTASGSSGYSGNCEFNSQTAANGSNCGDRSAQARPGGFIPPAGGS